MGNGSLLLLTDPSVRSPSSRLARQGICAVTPVLDIGDFRRPPSFPPPPLPDIKVRMMSRFLRSSV